MENGRLLNLSIRGTLDNKLKIKGIVGYKLVMDSLPYTFWIWQRINTNYCSFSC